MYQIYKTGKTLKEVGVEFGITAQYVKVLFNKAGYETRNKPRTRNKPSKLKGVTFEWESEKVKWDLLDTKIKGEVAENYVKNRLLELGFEVWVSITPNSKCDMAVVCMKTGKLIKIQVKCASYDNSCKRFRAIIATKDKSRQVIKYKTEDVDFFIVFCPFIKEFYVLPFGIVAHTNSIGLVPHRERFKVSENVYESFLSSFDILCKS